MEGAFDGICARKGVEAKSSSNKSSLFRFISEMVNAMSFEPDFVCVDIDVVGIVVEDIVKSSFILSKAN